MPRALWHMGAAIRGTSTRVRQSVSFAVDEHRAARCTLNLALVSARFCKYGQWVSQRLDDGLLLEFVSEQPKRGRVK